MPTPGDPRRTHLTACGADGIAAECVTYDQDLCHDAYVAEPAGFAAASARTARTPSATGEDARAVPTIALAAMRSGSDERTRTRRGRTGRAGTLTDGGMTE